MDTKERHIRENEGNADMIADSLPANGKNRKRKNTKKINNLWMWFGILILIAILLYWLFSIGIMEDMMNVFNG